MAGQPPQSPDEELLMDPLVRKCLLPARRGREASDDE